MAHSYSILVADDAELNRMLLREFFHMLSTKVLEANDGAAAVRAATESLPDLILMDIRMPGMDGISAARAIKSSVNTRHIPIVALSGEVDELGPVGEMPFDGCLSKPVRLSDLQREVARHLRGFSAV